MLERVRVGGSYLIAARVVANGVADEAHPLVYLDRVYHRIDGSTAL